MPAIGLERLAALMGEMFALSISEGAISNMLARARDPLLAAAAAIRDTVTASEVVCSDETSVRVSGKTWWEWVSCHRFAANAVRLQLHALAYNLANFLRTLALPEDVKHWSLTTLRNRGWSRSAPRSFGTDAPSSSRWPRSRCHARYSRLSSMRLRLSGRCHRLGVEDRRPG